MTTCPSVVATSIVTFLAGLLLADPVRDGYEWLRAKWLTRKGRTP